MAKIYIAGKVTGLPWAETSMKFGAHQKKLINEGHQPIVPLDLCNKDDDWQSAMRKCIAALITCEEIHLLHDWMYSPGARLERTLAFELGIKIVHVEKHSHATNN